MLTGDSRATAESVAHELPIDQVTAEVQPMDKIAIIERLQAQGARVAMAGDGSTMPPHLRKPMSVLRWARAPTSLWRVRRSRSSKAIYAASCARDS